MKNTIKFAALGVCALAASSTAALAGSELPQGLTTGIALGAPLPEGVYDITFGSYGSRGNTANSNLAYAIPVWLIWSTPWQIAGGRILLDTATGVADAWTPAAGHWHRQLAEHPRRGADQVEPRQWLERWLPGRRLAAEHAGSSDGSRPQTMPRSRAWRRSAIWLTAGICRLPASMARGRRRTAEITGRPTYSAEWFNLDLTATRKFGKFEIGAIGYGSWMRRIDGRSPRHPRAASASRASSLSAVLIGYDFGSFMAQVKLVSDVAQTNYGGERGPRLADRSSSRFGTQRPKVR